MIRTALSAPCLLLAAFASQAGVVIETIERNAATGTTSGGSRLYIDGDVLRVDQSLDEGRTDFVLFRDDTLYVVEPGERQYTAIDRKSVAAMAGQMNSAMAQMRAQLANLPPEQRKMMEQMMAGKMPGAAAPAAPLVARDLGRNETLDQRTCRMWELSRAEVVEHQVCVVPFGSLPGKEDLLGVMQRMNELMQPMVETFSGFGGVADDADGMAAVQGFPILWRDFAGGKPNGEETVLRSWREEAISPALLQLPDGYRRRDPLAGMGD